MEAPREIWLQLAKWFRRRYLPLALDKLYIYSCTSDARIHFSEKFKLRHIFGTASAHPRLTPGTKSPLYPTIHGPIAAGVSSNLLIGYYRLSEWRAMARIIFVHSQDDLTRHILHMFAGFVLLNETHCTHNTIHTRPLIFGMYSVASMKPYFM